MTLEQIKEKLCYSDMRNPYFSIMEENGYDIEEVKAAGNHRKEGCYCDNCFYGRTVLAEELLKLKTEEHE